MNRHCNSDDGICRKGCAGNAPCAQHTETATPKRYDWFTEDFGGDSVMQQADDGRYVLYEDYAVLQAKLAEAETASRMWHDHYQRLMDERDTLRTQLAKAQNEALERAKQAALAYRHSTYCAYPVQSGVARAIEALKSPNSAEGEPG